MVNINNFKTVQSLYNAIFGVQKIDSVKSKCNIKGQSFLKFKGNKFWDPQCHGVISDSAL